MPRASGIPNFGAGRFPAPTGVGSHAPSEIHAIPTASADDHNGNPLHPNNPLMAFGLIAATAFGLMAFSTSVRVGKTKAGLTIGDTK